MFNKKHRTESENIFYVLLETQNTSSIPALIILDWIAEQEMEFRNMSVLWKIIFLNSRLLLIFLFFLKSLLKQDMFFSK